MLQATIVFSKNWEAVHAKNADGSRKYRYIINRGSSRSSKTTSIIDVYDLYARSYSNKRLTVWRDTKTDCRKTVLNDVLKHLRSSNRYLNGQTFNKTESIFTYQPTHSTFEIHGTDDEITVHGLNQAAAWLNEPYKISRDVFDQIDQRTEDFIIIDYNPKQGHWVEDIIKDQRTIVIDSTFKDNPFCPPEQRRKILSYQPVKMCAVVEEGFLSEREANEYNCETNTLNLSDKQLSELIRCLENERKNSASEFNWSVYGLGLKAEQPNRIFKFEEIGLAEYNALDLPIYYANDWGVVDPWAVLEAKYNDGCLYLRELNYSSENEIRSKLTTTEQIQVAGAEEGLVTFWFKNLRIDPTKYIINDYNRPLKIRALRQAGYDYAIAAMKPKGSIIDGIALVNNLRVYYTSDSTNIKYEQENYSRDVDRFGKVLEEPVDTNNHHMDCVRYIATYLESRGIIRKV